MAAIRFLEEGYKSYIFFGNDGLEIISESFTGIVKDFAIAKAIVGELVKKDEVPQDMWDRVCREAFSIAVSPLK